MEIKTTYIQNVAIRNGKIAKKESTELHPYIKKRVSMWSRNSAFRCPSGDHENTNSEDKNHIDVYHNAVHNNQDMNQFCQLWKINIKWLNTI